MMKFKFSLVLAAAIGVAAPNIAPATAFSQECTCAGVGIRAERAPPPLPEYDQPPIPGPDYMWTPGYWSWNNYDYYWVPGTWVVPPQPELLWTPGYWGFSNGIYLFNAGYWGRHVGYYGGIAYGFGYTGIGYEGGYWNNRHFFYNRTVNNIGNVNITNVYNKTVINNTTINHISYNGGAGGITTKPTPEEEAASKEQHVQPTGAQIEHIRSASTNPSQFVTANHGKPTIAATPRLSAFSEPGVTRAGEAGAPISHANGTPNGNEPIKVAPGGKPLPTGPANLRPGEPNKGETRPALPSPAARLSTPKPTTAHSLPRPVVHAAPIVHRAAPAQARPPVVRAAPRQAFHAPAPRAAPRQVQRQAPRQAFRPQAPRRQAPRPAPRRACGPHQRC